MNLVRILRDPERQNLKKWFCSNFPNPGISEKKDIIVPLPDTTSSYSGEIGTAFDYLFRFNLERINQNKIIKKDWVAEDGYAWVMAPFWISKKKTIQIGYKNKSTVNRIQFEEFLTNIFDKAKLDYQKFINDGIVNDELIKSCIILAKFDVKVRSGITDTNFDNINNIEVEEIHKLISVVPWKLFKAKSCCYINPSFGTKASYVCSADADLIIDSTLIDIKTTKRLIIRREDLNQIIGYFLLSLIGGINKNIPVNINKIGFYYVRYGELLIYDVSEYFNKSEFDERIVNEFICLIKDRSLEYSITNVSRRKPYYKLNGIKL